MPAGVTGRRQQRLLLGAGGAASAHQARWVSPSPAMKAAPSVSQAGVSLPQHGGHLFQTWPCAGLSRALWGGSSIPGPCPHEASSSAQLWPPRGLLNMAECPLGSKAAWVESPRAAPATLQVELLATWCTSPSRNSVWPRVSSSARQNYPRQGHHCGSSLPRQRPGLGRWPERRSSKGGRGDRGGPRMEVMWHPHLRASGS